MKTLGIIVEYNPLHNGHVYHYEQSKQLCGADAVIAVMSGNFLQRGEPALVNKWARAEMALHMGADLVIELPIAYSCAPAEWFAYGSVSALHSTGVVDVLCFGSEGGETHHLKQLALQIGHEPQRFQMIVRQKLKQGVNYPSAYNQAIRTYTKVEWDGSKLPDLSKPNNTLGLHYLIALHRLNSNIQPLTITRSAAGYHQETITDVRIASATAIRNRIMCGQSLNDLSAFMPGYTIDILRRECELGQAPVSWDRFMHPLLHLIISRHPEQWSGTLEVTEGLQHRIHQTAMRLIRNGELPNFESFLDALKTKRYTRTKLQRTLLRILLGHHASACSKTMLGQGVPYLRVLGFSRMGQRLLKQMKAKASVPMITNINKDVSPMLAMDLRAALTYMLAYQQDRPHAQISDYDHAPIHFQ